MSQRAQDRRWQTKFGNFVSEFGAERLAETLEVRPPAVYQWVKGETAPTTARVSAILQIAAQNGFEISLEDIYQRSRRPIR
jgi:DNA-binding transcriptional regulator YdaS (Cro superfamily)